MESIRVRWLVLLEGSDEPIMVSTDQRDFANYEGVMGDGQIDTRHPLTHRHWAWTAMRRAGQIEKAVSWEKFNTELCVQVVSADVVEQAEAAAESEDEQGLDPGR